MRITFLLLAPTAAAVLCGCDQQTRLNTEKLQTLSSNLVQFEQSQSNHMAILRSQVASLGPMLDKINGSYFEKTHENAFFFHTNTLFLLLTVDRKIESELQTADTERQAEHLLAFEYHTNELGALELGSAQIRDAMAAQESRITDNVNAETRKVGEMLGVQLLQQIKLSAPDAAETARLNQMEADVAQIKRDLEQIKAQLGQRTNRPAGP